MIRLLKSMLVGLIGTNREYEVKGLGVFDSKVCHWIKKEDYTWSSSVQTPFYDEETIILLDGDIDGPSQQQILALRKLLHNWESILSDLDKLLLQECRTKRKQEIYASWRDTFFLEAICPLGSDKNEWEIAFERKDDLKDYFSFIWRDDRIEDLTLGTGV